jgi:hypothetical protein
MVNRVYGKGPKISFDVSTSEGDDPEVLDIHFLDDVYIKDGDITFLEATYGSYLTVEVMCPIGVPFPDPNGKGTLDFVNGSFVPNANGTGAFRTSTTETVLYRFINELSLLGTGHKTIESIEPFLMYYPYFLRYFVYNPGPTQLQATVTMGMYRKRTV